MHSFQNFIVWLIPNHPLPLETRIWKLVVRALIAINIRTDDGLTNGASNVIKHMYIHLTNDSKPSGLVWVQFDCDDVGKKTRQENRNLYTEGIQIVGLSLSPLQPNLL